MTLHNADTLRTTGTPFSRHLGLRYVEVAEGRAVTEIDMAEHLRNVVGGFHGAAAFALVDCAMGAAVYSLLAADELTATLEAKTNYIRPVSSGLIRCEATVVHKGRRTAVLDAEITANGKLIAKASGTFAIWKTGGD
jgi:acyl-CoA thioesterase